MKRSNIIASTTMLAASFLATLAPAAATDISFADIVIISERGGVCPGNEDHLSSQRYCAILEELPLSNPALAELFAEITREPFDLSAISEPHTGFVPINLFHGEGEEEIPEVPLPAGMFLFVFGLAAIGSLRQRKGTRP